MAYRAGQSEDNKSDHQNKKWTFFPIAPFCLGGLCREPGGNMPQVRPGVLTGPGYRRRSRSSAPDMPIVIVYVVTIKGGEGSGQKALYV